MCTLGAAVDRDLPSSLGAALAAERDRLRLTQAGAAGKLGTTQQNYGRWEKRGSRPDEQWWSAISDFLGVPEGTFKTWCSSWWPAGSAPRGKQTRDSADDRRKPDPTRADATAERRASFVDTFLDRWVTESMPSAVVEAVARELRLGE